MMREVRGATLAASGRGFDSVETEEGESGGCGTDPASLASVRLGAKESAFMYSQCFALRNLHGLFGIWFARGIL